MDLRHKRVSRLPTSIVGILEIKDEDREKFLQGELVEPKKPIVYYIDRATPEQWRSYIKQGIEDWQVAFEAAGFKSNYFNKDPPTVEEDPRVVARRCALFCGTLFGLSHPECQWATC